MREPGTVMRAVQPPAILLHVGQTLSSVNLAEEEANNNNNNSSRVSGC